MKNLLTSIVLLLSTGVVFGQGLEDIIVETYYISDANDATDTDGGFLPEGSVSYRIYVDMAPGYEVQAVYGNSNHTLRISTSTFFFNNEDRGATTGTGIALNRFDDNTVAADTYVTLGGPTATTLAVLKSEDTNGAVANSDGFMQSTNPLAGIPMSVQDGMIPGSLPSAVVSVGLDLSMFDNENSSVSLLSNGGAWSVLEGVVGPTPTNRVLLAQITTDGDLEFELNIQLGTPTGGVEQYVASNPIGNEQFFAGLTFPSLGVDGCTSATACNYNPSANNDDGSCLEPVAGCSECNGADLELIDSDGDGICDADDCLGDFNGDGTISSADLLVFVSQFGCSSNCTANLDADPSVSGSDFLVFLSLFGSDCQ
ncbi:MAG: hypothetical protein GC193_02500 [Cryomorphaceae bacterium]|nr:hypothetical protein [Cryomorphaceae bacterium]